MSDDIRNALARIHKISPSKVSLSGLTEKSFNRLREIYSEKYILTQLARESKEFAQLQKDYVKMANQVKSEARNLQNRINVKVTIPYSTGKAGRFDISIRFKSPAEMKKNIREMRKFIADPRGQAIEILKEDYIKQYKIDGRHTGISKEIVNRTKHLNNNDWLYFLGSKYSKREGLFESVMKGRQGLSQFIPFIKQRKLNS